MNENSKTPRVEGDELIIETQLTTETYDEQYLVGALLVFVAKGDGSISSDESAEMLHLLSTHFDVQSSRSLELITRALTDLAENPDFENLLRELSVLLNAAEKEEVAFMMLKIVAADGRRQVEEMEKFRAAVEILGMPDDVVHRVYDRYFEETQV